MNQLYIYIYLRQEIDGPLAEQLEFVPCGQILQDEEKEELSPSQIRDHISHSQGQGDLPDYTCIERLLEGQKGRGCHTIAGDVNLPIDVFARIHLGQEMRVHTWEDPEISQI